MKSPRILLSIVAAVTMTFGLSTSSVQAHDGSADLNHDGWVNSYDITILLSEWGHVADGVLHSDINGDFEVGAADFAILIGALGPVATTVSCKPIEPSLGKKLRSVISVDTVLYVDASPTSTNSWNGYLMCQKGTGPQALIKGDFTASPTAVEFKPLALMSGEDDIVLSSDTFFTPANKGRTELFPHIISDFLNVGIPLNFTPSTTTGYVKLLGSPSAMIFSYDGITHPNLPHCTDPNCCLLTGCKLVGSDPFSPTSVQTFPNGTITIECTAPKKGSTVSYLPIHQNVHPTSLAFNLTVLSTAGFDPTGHLSVKNYTGANTYFISYTSKTPTTFNNCKVVADSSVTGPNFTITAGMPISIATLSGSYTLKFSDLSGLIDARAAGAPATPYGIYAMGFATADSGNAWLHVDPPNFNSMKFCVAPTCTAATPKFYPVNKINESTTIILDSTVPLAGGRIYFFVLPYGYTNTFPFGVQPKLPTPEPFAFFEFTVPALTIVNSGSPNGDYKIPGNATFDVQQVDAFQFPMTMAWQTSHLDPLPISNSENNVIFGQKICDPISTTTDNFSASRESILLAFEDFFPAAASSPYRDLKMAPLAFNFPSSANPQVAGILAPSHYLETNVGSELNTVFDSDLKTLFSTVSTAANHLKIWGNQSDPAGITESYYDVTVGYFPYPTDPADPPSVTPAPLIPALKLTSQTQPTISFHIFSPVDTSIITTTTSAGVTSPIQGNLSQASPNSSTVTLTIPNPNPDLLTALGSGPNAPGIGMYVFNPACSSLDPWMVNTTLGVKSSIQISEIAVSSTNQLIITLSSAVSGTLTLQCTVYKFQFSRQPWAANLLTSGNMVFSNDGLFSDAAYQIYPTPLKGSVFGNVLSSLENQIVTALNRGVLVTPAIGKNPAKLTTNDSKDWSKQTGWYTQNTTYNEYSYFVHTATIPNASGYPIPISYTPFNAEKSGAGFLMSAAYGFGYDENSQVGDYPQVPSKLDGTVTPGSILTFTFGPWTDSNPACP